MTEAQDIARQTAQRLAARYGKELPMEVEKAILGGGQARTFGDIGDLAGVASFIVAVAAFAWQIWRDTRASGTAPQPEVLRRKVRLEVPAPRGVDNDARDAIIVEVVEEVVKS